MAERNSLLVHIFAPIGRDASAIAQLLQHDGFRPAISTSVPALVAALKRGAGAVIVAEEGLFAGNSPDLSAWVQAQPPWSDLQFIVLTSQLQQTSVTAWRERLVSILRNVSLLERPIQSITLTSAVRAALRARSRQYQLQELLESRERSAQILERLVNERTSELERANAELRTKIAEKAQAEESLRQAQKIEALGQLTGGVAHDFNNLLMVIIAGIEMLERRSDPAQRRQIVDAMRQAAQRGATLTRQLLTFSRSQQLKPEIVGIADKIGGMRELLERSLRGDVAVHLEFDDDLWPVEVDPGELELMVLNLAVNARDAMTNGGTITITARNGRAMHEGGLSGDFVCLSISDTGTGMAPDVLQHAFEPFFTTKEVGRGSGLGLAQVHGFAAQSGGQVRIESELGHGTTVHILLPRAAKPDLRRDTPAPGRDDRSSHLHVAPGASVLLVEDDDDVSALVTEMLNQLGYEVTRAASASAALGTLANGRKIDLVFSDVMMPGGMNGVELAREIHSRRADLPVLLTSGYAEAIRRSADEAGLRVLAKPYGITELASALKSAIARPSGKSAIHAQSRHG